jgi:ABC-type branched-subunit amino acid transport system substrate-binding protein
MLRRWIIVGVALIVLLSLLPACVQQGTPTPGPSPSPTPTPTPTGPVKICGTTAWTGPMGMSGAIGDVTISLVEYQVNEVGGGLLGGRELDIIPCDSGSTTAGCVACARQALYEFDASAMVWGGFSAADADAISGFCEENELPYFLWGALPQDLCDKKFTVRCTQAMPSMMLIADDMIKLFNPKTVACLALDTTDGHLYTEGWIDKFKAAGIDVVYEEYAPPETTDYTPYLTRIKSLNPDLLTIISTNEGYIAIAKQIVGLGGLGDTKILCDPPAENSMSEEGAQGWYYWCLWYIGADTPGGIKLEQDYEALYGGPPYVSLIAFYYNCVWTAINAIKLADSADRLAVAQAARSGNLEWEAPSGNLQINTCGEPGTMPPFIVRIQDKGVVPVQIPE